MGMVLWGYRGGTVVCVEVLGVDSIRQIGDGVLVGDDHECCVAVLADLLRFTMKELAMRDMSPLGLLGHPPPQINSGNHLCWQTFLMDVVERAPKLAIEGSLFVMGCRGIIAVLSRASDVLFFDL
jgi:hypothetical protein